MRLVFLNPQGNFDPRDSYLTEHPDFGGQLVYVKELAKALVDEGHQVDIVTRQINDPNWPEFAGSYDCFPGYEQQLRILRFPCGPPRFLEKEKLWPHLAEFVDNLCSFYGKSLPDFATAHYADGGLCGTLLKQKRGVPFCFTGHSLGAQKLDKLGTNSQNWKKMDTRYRFARRIAAERLSFINASRIVVSTKQEQVEQYGHPLYTGSVDCSDNSQFAVISPGVNESIFTNKSGSSETRIYASLDEMLGAEKRPAVLVSSRLDEKKNIVGVAEAFSYSSELREKAVLILCLRGISDPVKDIVKLRKEEQIQLKRILNLTERPDIKNSVYFVNIGSQIDLAATYRYFARRGSVFALTSFYEPFGLAPLEAGASGLAPVVTKHGGPSEIFSSGSGVLVDPFQVESIVGGLIDGLDRYQDLSDEVSKLVREQYTWRSTCQKYIDVVSQALKKEHPNSLFEVSALDEAARIETYLASK